MTNFRFTEGSNMIGLTAKVTCYDKFSRRWVTYSGIIVAETSEKYEFQFDHDGNTYFFKKSRLFDVGVEDSTLSVEALSRQLVSIREIARNAVAARDEYVTAFKQSEAEKVELKQEVEAVTVEKEEYASQNQTLKVELAEVKTSYDVLVKKFEMLRRYFSQTN